MEHEAVKNEKSRIPNELNKCISEFYVETSHILWPCLRVCKHVRGVAMMNWKSWLGRCFENYEKQVGSKVHKPRIKQKQAMLEHHSNLLTIKCESSKYPEYSAWKKIISCEFREKKPKKFFSLKKFMHHEDWDKRDDSDQFQSSHVRLITAKSN